MSTVEKLFFQIVDRKRQIIQQLNHQKQLYDQHLASKLLIQGFTPPTWLLNSDRFASYSVPSSNPADLNKEELISGLLLPGPQPVPYYCNATHLYGQPLPTVGNGDLKYDQLNATDAGAKGLDDCGPGHSPQCLIRELEDVHHVAESPKEKAASGIYGDLDQSLARMQRSKSRQKALELRSSRKASIKCQLEGTPATGPRRHDASNEECATPSGEVLITSVDICLQKKQDVSSKEDGTDAPNNMMSPHSHCLDVSVKESLIAAENIPSKEGMYVHLLKEKIVRSDESYDRKQANADLFKDKLIDNQCVSREEDTCTPNSKCDNAQNIRYAERLVAIELPENIIAQLRRPASLGVPPSNFHASHYSDRKMNVHYSAPVGILKQTNLTDTSVLSGKSNDLLAGNFGCNAIATDAPTNLLSLCSDRQDLPVEESVVADESVSMKGGIPAPVGVLVQTKIGVTGQSDVTGQISEGEFMYIAIEKDAPTDLMSHNSDSRELYIEKSLVAKDSVSSKGGIFRHLLKDPTHMDGSFDRKCANPELLTEDLIRKKEVLPKGEDIFLCHTKELEASSDLLSPKKHIEIDAPTNLMSSNNGCRDLNVEESLVAEHSAFSKGGISRHLLKESVVKDVFCDGKSANSNQLPQDLRDNPGLSQEVHISLCQTKELEAQSHLLSPQKHIPQPELEQSYSPSSERVNRDSNPFVKDKVLEEAAAEGTLIDNLLHAVKGEGLKSCSVELTSDFDLENQCGLSSGKDSRESQRRYKGSTDHCKSAEWSGATANELTSSNSEDSMKHASFRQKQEVGDARFDKEDKIFVSPKLLELQTLGINSSPTCFVVGSWPRQKRRKIEPIVSRSASPHLRVNSSSIFSSEACVAKSLTDDFSAARIFHSDTSSLGILPGHSSMRQHKEEKLNSQGSIDVAPDKLKVHIVSCLTQHLTATPQECLHRDDQSTGNCDISFSISKADGNLADNKFWQEEDSSEAELHNMHNCLSGPSFVENEEAVGAEGGMPDLEFFTFDKKLQNAHGDVDADMDEVDEVVEDILDSSTTALHLQKVNEFLCVGDSQSEERDSVGRKASVEDLVNFTFYSKCEDNKDPEKAIDRAEFLERLCRSGSLGLSFSNLHESYSSDMKEDVCHSVPAGVFEQTDSRYISPVNDSTGQLLKASHTSRNVEYSEFQENSFSNYSPIHGTPFAWNSKGPYTSPFEKSRSSSTRCSSNPELTCFPIEESGEEDVSADDSDDNCPDRTGLVRKSSCSASEEYMNDPAYEMLILGSVSTETSIRTSTMQGTSGPEITCIPEEEEESSEQHVDVVAPQPCQETIGSARKPLRDISKQETESFSRTINRSEVYRKNSRNPEAEPYQSGRLRKRKITQNISLGTTAKKHFESRPTRFCKSKASLKSGLETRGGSLSVKEAKPNNIVSSIISFLPLVQQKQAASCAPVKKEVRVKALEAAEAAKRLAEKKENKRNQKKEALKLERARAEQEKVKQLELVKKAKEEERKRKEAEIAERKRKREEEEEEKKEKEKKRKRIAEARKQKKGQGDKIPLEKQECKSQAEAGKTDTRRGDDAGTEKMVAGGLQDFPAIVAGCSTPTPDVSSQTICEKSYDISPYCCSDEEDEEDDLPDNKFIPAWASKSSSMKRALVSLVTVDAEVIFPPSSFCSLNEVLLPRELKQR